MQFIFGIINFILHIDVHLQTLLNEYGIWLYGILFAIIFIETGLVLIPFLPGDSLLFVAGSLSGGGYLDIVRLLVILFVSAILGDTVNYHIGKYFGHHILKLKIWGRYLIKPEYIEKTKYFFDKYGKRTIILARFVPIVRTLAPFIAGIGDMNYRTFLSYNVIGGFVWVFSLTLAGYFFGQIPLVKENFEKVVIGIILISLLPILIEYIKHKYCNNKDTELKLSNALLNSIGRKLGKSFEDHVRSHLLNEIKSFSMPKNEKLVLHLKKGILPGYSLYRILCENGLSKNNAIKIFDEVMEYHFEKRRKQITLLGYLPFFYKILRLGIKLFMKDYPPEGWNIEWHEISKKCIRFDMKSCFYFDTLKFLGTPELTKSFCKCDDFMYKNMSKNCLWDRKKTIGRGDHLCDFCFINLKDKNIK